MQKEASEAKKQIDRYKEVDEESPIAEVHKRIEHKFGGEKLQQEVDKKEIVNKDTSDKKNQFITSSMSKLSKSERKLVGRLLAIITEIAPKEMAEKIIDKIKEELR